VHEAPTCAGSEKGYDHFRSYIRSLLLHFCKRLFLRLEHIITRQQLYRCTSAPLHRLYIHIQNMQRCTDITSQQKAVAYMHLQLYSTTCTKLTIQTAIHALILEAKAK
jgi:hypothetical protein